ncbi:transglycosylase domain-containing protein [Paraliobacillus ryukyuensis]|uniref:transglycosylase domain-containing protein n=1 Tax=Paraliobacillus ryukyuensis TaxID=200904 RepID=UPI0009A90573|nr:PBP1A family penicillin-binding protein [Paraliobacillus ryukyuensis]
MKRMRRWIRLIKHKPLRFFLYGFLLLFSGIVGSIITIYCYALILGPPDLDVAANTTYYSADGTKIGQEQGVETREWVELDAINSDVIDTTVQVEDKRFYHHHGFDSKRILAAGLKNIQSVSLEEGASTITQQYARNLFLTHEKTWGRKLKEAFYALRLELFYDKDTILEGYLNTIYYGHGIYGIEAASQFYFQKANTDLSLAEASLLVGIPNRPNDYSPILHMDQAKQRQENILDLLYKQGEISETAHFLATHEHLEIRESSNKDEHNLAPYYQDVVMEELKKILQMKEQNIRTAGFHVTTTLDIAAQNQLEKAKNEHLPHDTDMQVGAIAMNPVNGAIEALIGGADYQKSQFNRATQAKRMAGSTFKPFLYYAALSNGYTATTTLRSQPTTFILDDGSSYQPSNFNGYYADKEITLAQALAVSDNIYAVKTNLFLTPARLVKSAKKFGITSEMKAVPSLALGTASVSVREMVSAYSMLANGGKEVAPYTVEKIETADGEVIYQHKKPTLKQELDPQATFILTQLMTGMFDSNLNGYMHVTGESIAPTLHHTYAGKSGTTASDSWMIGFSTDLVTGVWTGYDDNQALTKTKDKHAAKEIWASMMEAIHSNKEPSNFIAPSGIIAAYVDPISGGLATPYCDTSRLMYFVKGTEPRAYCSRHRKQE